MSSSLRLLAAATGFALESHEAIRRAFRDVIGEELLPYAQLSDREDLVAWLVAQTPPRPGATEWVEQTSRDLVVRVAHIDAAAACELRYVHEHDAAYDVALFHDATAVSVELVDERGLADLVRWIEGADGAPPRAELEPLQPLVEELAELRRRDDPARVDSLQRLLAAHRGYCRPTRWTLLDLNDSRPGSVSTEQLLHEVLGPAAPPRSLIEAMARAIAVDPEALESLAPGPGGRWFGQQSLPDANEAAQRAPRWTSTAANGRRLVEALHAARQDGRGLLLDSVSLGPQTSPTEDPFEAASRWRLSPTAQEAFCELASAACTCTLGAAAELRFDEPDEDSERLAPRPHASTEVALDLALPICTVDLDEYLLGSSPRQAAYWRQVQPAWELTLVRSLFPQLGPGFRLDLDEARWSAEGVWGRLRATLAGGATFERDLLVASRGTLDGSVDHLTGQVDEPLILRRDVIERWRGRLLRASASTIARALRAGGDQLRALVLPCLPSSI